MIIREDTEINDQGSRVTPRLTTLYLTRRALSARVAVAACGAVAMSIPGFFADRALAAAPTTDCGATAAQPAASPAPAIQVIIENFTFSPETLTVPVGTEVTWENRDDIPHTVTSDDTTTFASTLLDTGDRFSFQFTQPGTYPYFCSVHPTMTAKVIVESREG